MGIRNSGSFSYTLSYKDRIAFCVITNKQSLVVVCFAVLQRLGLGVDECCARISMNENLYMTWIGKIAKI